MRVAIVVLKRALLPTLLLLLLVALMACSESGSDSPATPTATPLPNAPTTSTPQATRPDGQKAYEHVLALARDIGPRPAGTAQETRAVEYIVEELSVYGYTTEVQSFSFRPDLDSSLQVVSPQSREVPALVSRGSGTGRVAGPVVFAGLGRPQDFAGNSFSERIALVERGEIEFRAKVANALAAGSAAVIIFNNQPGPFRATLGEGAAIPVLSISQEDGRQLRAMLAQGTVVAQMAVEDPGPGTARNVVARPAGGGPCITLSGGHFDSVPESPGATDNASGTAAVLELARVVSAQGISGGHCFALFGAEELGLLGSRHFVETLSQEQREQIRAMLNFDVVASGQQWEIIASEPLLSESLTVAREAGISATAGAVPQNVGSDHKSFLDAGIPAVFFIRSGGAFLSEVIHTPADTPDRVQPQELEEAVTLGMGLLRALSAAPNQ